MIGGLRRATTYEVILLIVGISIGIIGFHHINRLFIIEGYLTPELLMATFLWLILIVLLVLTATMADVKEELATVIRDEVEEIKLLKDIEHDMLKELRLMRQEHHEERHGKNKK